jgi:hypothetical protein
VTCFDSSSANLPQACSVGSRRELSRAPLLGFFSRLTTSDCEPGLPGFASPSTFPSRAFSAPQGLTSRNRCGLVSCRCRPSGFRLQSFSHTRQPSDHFWPGSLLVLRDNGEFGAPSSFEAKTQHLSMPLTRPSPERRRSVHGRSWANPHAAALQVTVVRSRRAPRGSLPAGYPGGKPTSYSSLW